MIPTVTKVSKAGREAMDIFSLNFTENRSIFLFSEITLATALETIVQLRYLDSMGDGDIRLFINSPGGSVSDGFAIVDAIRGCKADVSTICTGTAASMAAFILACGTKGKRFATPLSEVMLHQPLGGIQGQASDIELHAKHIARVKDKLYGMLSEATEQPLETIARDCDRDYFMSADEAVKYGVVDGLLK